MTADNKTSAFRLLMLIINKRLTPHAMPVQGGGTVFHNNAILSEDANNIWGLDFTEEKETVLIITEKEKKLKIMKAICDSCGINSEAKDIVLSLPIDSIMGLNS